MQTSLNPKWHLLEGYGVVHRIEDRSLESGTHWTPQGLEFWVQIPLTGYVLPLIPPLSFRDRPQKFDVSYNVLEITDVFEN